MTFCHIYSKNRAKIRNIPYNTQAKGHFFDTLQAEERRTRRNQAQTFITFCHRPHIIIYYT